MGLFILQWNAFSIICHKAEFLNFISNLERNPDVICVQETFLKEGTNFVFPGYNVLRKDGLNGRGGVAFLIRKEISYSNFHSIDGVEAISVTIPTVSGDLEVVNIYSSPSVNFDTSIYTNIFNKENALLCGDFNAYSCLWGSSQSNHRGKLIESILDESNMVLLNTGLPTRYHSSGCSHIDLSFISPSLASKTVWDVYEESCASDHNVISISISVPPIYDDLAVPKWKFDKADWNKFAALCEEKLSDIDVDGDDFEASCELITDAIIQSADISIPKSSGKKGKYANPFWNEECSQAIKDREKAKRIMKRSYDFNDVLVFKRAKAVATKVINCARRRSWRKYCSSLSRHTRLGSVWKVIKKMNNVNSNESIPSIKVNGKFSKNNTEKANIFAKHYAKVSSNSNYDNKFKDHKTQFEKSNESVFQKKPHSNSVLNKEFSISELKRALKKSRRTSPGKDLLCYEMFSRLTSVGQSIILRYFNHLWNNGSFPSVWRHSVIIPILKPNKVKSDPASYRPIALTSNFCKLFERLVTFRLSWYLEKMGLINKNQSGFRSKKSTYDQLLKLSDDIINGFHKKSLSWVFSWILKRLMIWFGEMVFCSN